jgi:hypothetical protein
MAVPNELRLEYQSWRVVTIDAVHLAFARAEWHRLPGTTPAERHLIDSADLTDDAENKRRRQLLYGLREPLMRWVPSDTAWYEVQYLEAGHLGELLVIGRCCWDDAADRNELPKVARRRSLVLNTPPARWSEPILWGHSRTGPFTILEGNKRLVAYAATSTPPKMKIPVYVGLSPTRCIWHLPDPIT